MAKDVAKAAEIPLRQVSSIKQLLHNNEARGQLAAVAAAHMKPERMMRVVANAIRTTPKLQECEPISFLGALMQCASLGLEPNTVLGHAYLIPFDKSTKDPRTGRWVKVPQVQLIVGYKGLIDLARRSGHITSISANIHYSDDELWEYEEGTEARLRHIPGAQDGEKMHAYAIAKFKEGGHAYVVLPWAQVMKIRNGSQGWQSAVKFGKTEGSPWYSHEDAMAKKTAIRALAKYLPLSIEFTDAVQVDNDSGAHADFAAFAINPDDGVTIDGEASNADPVDNTDEVESEDSSAPKEEPKPKAATKPRRTTKAKVATKEEEKPAEDQPGAAAEQEEPEADDAQLDVLRDAITGELENATTVGDVAEVKELWAEQVAAQNKVFRDEIQKLYQDAEGDLS